MVSEKLTQLPPSRLSTVFPTSILCIVYVKRFRLKGQIFVRQNYKSNSKIGKTKPAGVEGIPDGEKNRDAHKKGRLSSCLHQKAIIFAHTRQHKRLIGQIHITLDESTPCGFLALGRRVTRKSWGMSFAAGGLYSHVFLEVVVIDAFDQGSSILWSYIVSSCPVTGWYLISSLKRDYCKKQDVLTFTRFSVLQTLSKAPIQ